MQGGDISFQIFAIWAGCVGAALVVALLLALLIVRLTRAFLSLDVYADEILFSLRHLARHARAHVLISDAQESTLRVRSILADVAEGRAGVESRGRS